MACVTRKLCRRMCGCISQRNEGNMIPFGTWIKRLLMPPDAPRWTKPEYGASKLLLTVLHVNDGIRIHVSWDLTIGSYVSVRSSRYEARGMFGEHERCVKELLQASWALSKLPKGFISRWTHSWRKNQLFYNISNPKENSFLEGFVCWCHERAQ